MHARFFRGLGVAVAVVLLAAPSAFGQATGKIQGRVVDAESGEPIGGATVRVLGTTRGGITSEEGYYFINEVPAGLQAILAEYIGHRTYRIENERILAGQTTTLNFELEPAAIELEPLVVEGERNPLVPRDQVSSKAIITGELIDQLPIDNVADIAVLAPGMISTRQGVSIRGSRPNEEAVYVDGVLTRRYSTGQTTPIELPTNALAEVDVTTGGIGAQFAGAQSGVINYVTKTGGRDFEGTFSLYTDQLGPKAWRHGFNRAEATFGGPLWRAQNLSFFVAANLEGRKYTGLSDGWNKVPILLNDGSHIAAVDPETGVCRECELFGFDVGDRAVFAIPRISETPGGTDSVLVEFPEFTEWDNGPNRPYSPSDEYTFVGKLNWGLGGGSNVDFSYKRERDQSISLGLSEIYNPDGWDGSYGTADVLTLGGYFLIQQTARSALALDLNASYQRYFDQSGYVDPQWVLDHRDPFLGFNFSNVDFMVDWKDFPVTEKLLLGARSGVIPQDSLQLYPGRFDLASRQSVPGVEAYSLRLNPYGMRTDWPIGGPGNDGLEYVRETSWSFNGALDWQAGRHLRVQTGGDLSLIHAEERYIPLYSGWSPPNLNDPARAGLFATGRLDLDDVVIDAGVRWDYFDADGEYPVVPGFVENVPDSMKADFWRLEAYDPDNPRSLEDRIVPLEDCGGELTAAGRTNPGPDGELDTADDYLVCKPNFIRSEKKSVLSPKLGVAFPVTVKSTFRLSYSHNVWIPPLSGTYSNEVSATAGLYRNMYDDLVAGRANTNTTFGRDVELPRTVLFEAGYRQLIGEDLVVDLAAYSKTVRNALTLRKLPFTDPNTGAGTFLNVVTNADYSQIRGVDVRIDKRFGQFADVSANYSFVDARGTGSDPYTYTGLLLRRNTNLSIITHEPVIPPDVMLRTEQSRTHNFAGTFSLLFPPDFQAGTVWGKLLADFGMFATFRVASGLPFTMLENSANGQRGPPSFAGLGGIVAEELNSSEMPWEKRLNVRFIKGFNLRGRRVLLFVDWRNPLNLENTNRIFLETGTAENELFKDKILNQQMNDPLLDGDTRIDDFNIAYECQDLPINVFSLLQAERRYGNGDGIFTVAEQREAFGAYYDLFWGRQTMVESTQRVRLGFEIRF